jgi:hypothetical protein
MAGRVLNIKARIPLKLHSGFTGKYHATRLPTIIVDCTNSVFYLAVVYMCVFGLNKLKNDYYQ